LAGVLDRLSNEGEGPVSALIDAIDGLATEAEKAQAVESLVPTTHAASRGAGAQVANSIQGIVEQRQTQMLGMSSGDGLSDGSFWFKPFAAWGEQSSKGGVTGFDVDAQGFGVGVDIPVNKPGQRIGGAFFATTADVKAHAADQKADITSYSALLYGNVPQSNGINFLYQLGYGYQDNEARRNFNAGDYATAFTSDYTSETLSVDLKWQGDWKPSKALWIQPMLEFNYRHFATEAYTEQGGEGAQAMQSFSDDEMYLTAGAQGRYALGESASDLALVGNLNLGYALMEADGVVVSSFVGEPGETFETFETQSVDNGPWRLNAGFGVEGRLSETSRLNVGYNYQQQGDFSNHIVSARYELKF
jgi:outer membrane autotransporter protein